MYAQLILPSTKSEMPKSRAIAGTMAEIDPTLNAIQHPCRHRIKKTVFLISYPTLK